MSSSACFSSKVSRCVAGSFPMCLTAFRTASIMPSSLNGIVVSWLLCTFLIGTPLITFGSPLDKTAFIFRSHLRSAVFREALAGAKQPLIQSYDFRPEKWINIYSKLDIISGSLDFYDNPDKADGRLPGDHKRIDNRIDEECRFPLFAHVEYWGHSALRDALYEGIGLAALPHQQKVALDNHAA